MSCNDDWNYTPASRNLTLIRGGGFDRVLTFRDKETGLPWVIPVGTTVRYVFGDVTDPIDTWDGVVAGSTVTFAETPLEVDLRTGTTVRFVVDEPTKPARVMTLGQVNWR